MADNSTEVNVNAGVTISDKASKAANDIAKGFEAIGKSAESASSNITKLENILDLINQLYDEGKISKSTAEKASAKMADSIKSETTAHRKNAEAIKVEADSLKKFADAEKKRAEAYKKNVNFKTSKEGLQEAKERRDSLKAENDSKTERQRMKNEAKQAELAEKAANRKLREQNRQDRIKRSRYGARSVAGQALGSLAGMVENRGVIGRGVGIGLEIGAAGLIAGPAGAAAASLVQVTKAFIDLRDASLEAYGSIEKIKTQMGVVFGSNVQAESVFSELSKYAVKSPFGLEDISEFSILLRQSGVYSSDLLNTLKMIGDTAGGDNEKMKRIANNYAQIVAVGKASMLDMRQFAYAGIPIYKEVADYLKVSQAELRKMISDGQVSAEVIEEVFKRMTSSGGVFNQATEKGALTLAARKQNLEDIKNLALAQIGEVFMNLGDTDTLGGYEKSLLNVQEEFYEGIKKWGETTNLVSNVNKLASGRSKIQELEQQKKDIENNDKFTKEEKEILNSFIDKQIALLTQGTSPEKSVSQGALLQRAFEDRDASEKRLNELQEVWDKLKEEALKMEYNESTPIYELYGTVDEYLHQMNPLLAQEIEELRNTVDIYKKLNKVKMSQYERELSAGVSSAITYLDTNTDIIEKEKKKKAGSITVKGKFDSLYAATEKGKQEAAEKEKEFYESVKKDAQEASTLIQKLNSGKLNYKDLSLNQIYSLETNWIDDMAGKRGVYATDYLTGMDENASFKSNETLKSFLDVANDAKNVLSSLSDKTGDTEIQQKINNLLSDIRYGKMDEPLFVKNFFTDFNKIAGSIDKKLKENLTADERDTYEKISVILGSIFRENKYATNGLENIDLSLLDTASGSGKSVDLEPLWKRIIASSTGLNVDMMRGMNAKQILETQLEPTLARDFVSSAISSVFKYGNRNGENKGQLNYAYKLLSYNGLKTLGDGDRGGNLATTKNIASEKTKSSKATAVNALGGIYKTAQIGWEQSRNNLLEAAKSGELNTEVLRVMRQNINNQQNILSNLLVASLKQSEDSQYVKGSDFNEAFVNAFSGLNFTDNGMIKGSVYDEKTGTYGPEQTLTFDKEAKSWKTASGEIIDSSRDIKFSLENLSNWIDKFAGELEKQANELGGQTAKQTLGEIFASMLSDSAKQLAIARYTNDVMKNSSLRNEPGAYGEVYNSVLSATRDVLSNYNGNSPDEVYKLITDTLEVKNLVTEEYDKNAFERNKNKEESSFIAAYNKNVLGNDLMNTRGFNGIHSLGDLKNFVTGNDGSMRKKALELTGIPDGESVNELFGKARIDELKKNASNPTLVQEHELRALEKEFGEDFDINSFTGDWDKLGEVLLKVDANFLKVAETMTSVKEGMKEIGTNLISSSLVDMSKMIGENFGDWDAIMKEGGKHMKELGQAAMSNLSSLFIQAGLSIIAANPASGLIPGLALIAAGGMAGIVSGLMSRSDEEEEDDGYERLKAIKEDLSDLLDQARNDAIYYENELRHQNALSTSERLSGNTKAYSVHDALISSNGNIITTDPKDYLIATKHPEDFGRAGGKSSPNIAFNIVNNSSGQIQASYKTNEDKDGNISIEAILEDKILEVISSPKSDDAFNSRTARLQGRSVIA